MKREWLVRRLPFSLAALTALAVPGSAHADDPYALTPIPPPAAQATPAARVTWGAHGNPADAASASRHDAPVTRARELLVRARFLDDAASVDEKAANDLTAKLPALRIEAKAARDRADRAATPEQRDLLGARAEDLETDVTISEAEITFKRKTASDNRRVAHELRVRAVKLVREEPATGAASAQIYDPTASACDPPFRYTQDGRKVYRIECLKP